MFDLDLTNPELDSNLQH